MKKLAGGDPLRVGRYTVFAELGRGAMGRVLLGHAPDGKLVAVKLLREQFTADEDFRARFAREVAASRKVSGADITRILDADPDARTPWFASVYEPGPSLRDAVKKTGPLPKESVLWLARDLASALAEIHRAGIVHRDLKPSNVMLTKRGSKVIDFGIARATDGGTDLTRSGWLIGTAPYMSPEQAEGERAEAISDVFSLGSVLAFASTGTGPFEGISTSQALYRVVHTEPDLGAVPKRVRAIIEMCLVKDPAARPSPSTVLQALGAVPEVPPRWPKPVRALIRSQEAELLHLLAEAGDGTTLIDKGTTLRFATQGFKPPAGPKYSSGKAKRPADPPPVTDTRPPPPKAPPTEDKPPAGPKTRPVVDTPPPRPKGPALDPAGRIGSDPAEWARVKSGAVLVGVLLLVFWIVGAAVSETGGDDDGGSTGSYETPAEEPYTPPEKVYTPPAEVYTPPVEETTEEEPSFDWGSLDDEDTDETPMTTEALLPNLYTDTENVEDYELESARMHGCEDVRPDGGEIADALRDAGCEDAAIGTYLDEGADVLVTLMIMPLESDGAAEAAYERVNDAYVDDWSRWCPSTGPGWNPCEGDAGAASERGQIAADHRYLILARAIYTDLRDTSDDSELLDASEAAVDAVEFGP
ncbi:protein kinase [Phytomonospora sp. NPDC050363]|uniref:serine/threonine-protein kinase n=1 Tax=Phytomonospora sp. NPDC050363 TaxID=3155642 RepID=UPI0033DCEC19